MYPPGVQPPPSPVPGTSVPGASGPGLVGSGASAPGTWTPRAPAFPAGWYVDPKLSNLVRYWDGTAWTPWIAERPKPPAPPHPTIPLWAGVGALLTILVSLVASRYVIDALSHHRWPIAVYVVIAGVIGYGPVLVFCTWASHRWGRRSLRADSGLFAKWVDAGWGPVTWLCCLATQIVLGIIVVATGIPFSSNTEGIDAVGGERGYVIATLVLAVVAAPLVEEIVFRGIVLRSFLAAMHPVAAIGLQGVLFGMAHFDPVRGTGNIGLVMVLGGVGITMGGAAYLFRRITPTIIAHAIINAIAMTVALTGWGQ